MNTKYLILLVAVFVLGTGCRSPYYADRGALFGGVGGAGVGALVGDAVADNPESGALVGAAVGAITGAAVGSSLDEIEARNRAQIEAQMGRPMVGAATIQDVVAMSQAGVSEEVIVTYLQNNGCTGTLQSGDIVFLTEQGVSSRVIQSMQNMPPRPVGGPGPPPPVVIHERVYHEPWCNGPHWRHHHHYRRPPPSGVSWGISVSN